MMWALFGVAVWVVITVVAIAFGKAAGTPRPKPPTLRERLDGDERL